MRSMLPLFVHRVLAHFGSRRSALLTLPIHSGEAFFRGFVPALLGQCAMHGKRVLYTNSYTVLIFPRSYEYAEVSHYAYEAHRVLKTLGFVPSFDQELPEGDLYGTSCRKWRCALQPEHSFARANAYLYLRFEKRDMGCWELRAWLD